MMEASIGKENIAAWTEGVVPAWAVRVPLVKDVVSTRRVRLIMLRLTMISSMSFLAGLALMVVKNPAYFGVVMNVAGRQLLLSQRTKICRHQIDAEKIHLSQN
jgi:hypothetical protein